MSFMFQSKLLMRVTSVPATFSFSFTNNVFSIGNANGPMPGMLATPTLTSYIHLSITILFIMLQSNVTNAMYIYRNNNFPLCFCHDKEHFLKP